MVDHTELGVRPTDIALPVGVLRNVTGGSCDRVVVVCRVVAAGGRVAEERIERDAGGSAGVDLEIVGDGGPDAFGLDGEFLREGAVSVKVVVRAQGRRATCLEGLGDLLGGL